MIKRRSFIKRSVAATLGTALIPSLTGCSSEKVDNVGIQLYSVRNEMMTDAMSTLKKLAELGYKELESAGSEKGYYYGLSPQEIRKVCGDLGMNLRSGHVRLDDRWEETLDLASQSGQEFVIVSSMPTEGQTVDNYRQVADQFMKAGEECKKRNIKFGYHNHDYEFEQENGQVLYDVLMDNTDKEFVHMELDLGWVVAAGKDPLDYFNRYPGRFPLWHLKDMDLQKKESTEFGKGGLDIPGMLRSCQQSGLAYLFVEQEEYANTPFESMKHNMEYLRKLEH